MELHTKQLDKWMHDHSFSIQDDRAERRTRWVVFLTAATMAAEIIAGWLSGSMALLADGWHMGTHMFALGITLFAYRFARRHRDNPAFSFGTGKVNSLAGFTSAIVLAIVALGMIGESVSRLISPVEIHFWQAFSVACIGFLVNILSAWMLHLPGRGEHAHHHEHQHDDHQHGHGDHNLKAAFLHVVTDAFTSVLAMVALLAVHFWGLRWVDPAVGILGALVIAVWAYGLLKETARMLLDAGVDLETIDRIKQRLEVEADNRVADLHVWSLGGRALSIALTIVTHYPRPPAYYRQLLNDFPRIQHSTIEVVECKDEACVRFEQNPDKPGQGSGVPVET